jgi:hypothetical protein
MPARLWTTWGQGVNGLGTTPGFPGDSANLGMEHRVVPRLRGTSAARLSWADGPLSTYPQGL